MSQALLPEALKEITLWFCKPVVDITEVTGSKTIKKQYWITELAEPA